MTDPRAEYEDDKEQGSEGMKLGDQAYCVKYGCQGGQLCLENRGWNLCARIAVCDRADEVIAGLEEKVSDAEYWGSDNPAVFDDAAIHATVEDEINGVKTGASCFYPSDFWLHLREERAAREAAGE